MNFFSVLANKEAVASYISMVMRLCLGVSLYPFFASSDPLIFSVWLFCQLLGRFRDIFDLGYFDNFTREYSYLIKDGNLLVRSQLFLYSNRVYRRLSVLCFLVQVALISIWFVIDITKLSTLNAIVLLFVCFSNAIYLFGNKYLSMLYGLNYIFILRIWDAILNGITLIFIVVVYQRVDLIDYALFILPILNILIVIRNVVLVRHVFKIQDVALNIEHTIKSRINYNARRELKSSFWLMGLIQGVNYGITVFLPINVSNIYLFLDQVSEHIRNFSRVPFYVKRPAWAQYFKEFDRLPGKDVRIAFSTSIILLVLGYITLYSIQYAPMSFSFDLNTPLFATICFLIFSVVERVCAMMNQLNLILSNVVITHTIYRNIFLVSFPLILGIYFFELNIFYIPLVYAASYNLFFLRTAYAKLKDRVHINND